MDTNEWLSPHYLGTGLKEWEQTAGPYPSALAFLLAHNPGNMPADVGHHPMAGRWAGHRVLSVGDYAENGDIRKFQGPPLKRLYGLCDNPPKLEDFTDRWYWAEKKNGGSQFGGYDFPWRMASRADGLKRYCETAAQQFAQALRYQRRKTVNGRYPLFTDVSPKLRGAIEYVQSVRFCGSGWVHDVPVKSYAERGKDGHLHYRITDTVARNLDDWNLTLRMTGIGGWKETPQLNPYAELMPDGERWPWDRPPADLSWHDATDADQDLGQHRVWVNLERREYIDPNAFGEVSTTLGIMRATAWQNGSFASSAAAVLAMLHYPQSRGGGDIDPEHYALKGRWRNCRLALTAEHSNDALIPTTEEAKTVFTNISDEATVAAVYAVKRDQEAA